MVSSVQPPDSYAPEAGKLSHRDKNTLAFQLNTLVQDHVIRLCKEIGTYPVRLGINEWGARAVLLTQGIVPKLRMAREKFPVAALSDIRKLLPSRSVAVAPDANAIAEIDHVAVVLSDLQSLPCEQHHKVAHSLALLWDAFIDVFGGVSAFQAASPIEQQAYVGKLETAARRMEAARGSDAAFRYVTVELMRQYVSFLQTGSKDPNAIALARAVAPLIDRGRSINEGPSHPQPVHSQLSPLNRLESTELTPERSESLA